MIITKNPVRIIFKLKKWQDPMETGYNTFSIQMNK